MCQMAQRAGRPAARGAQEEIREEEEEEGVTVTSKSELCSAGVLGYVTRYIIIRGRPRPAECQPLSVRSRLL